MGESVRILIVEDLPTDAELAEREIRGALESCEFRRVETRADYLAALEAFQPDLIVSDYRMPHFDGLTALKLAQARAPLTPVIIWTGSINEDTAVECMKAGAANYVIKEHLKRLGQSVIHALEEKQLRQERRRAEEALRESEERFRSLYENATIGLYRTTPEGRILMVNPAAMQMLGYDSFEELAQRDLEKGGFEPAYPRSEFRRRLESEGVITGLESAWIRRDGTTLFVRESARAVRDERGKVLYYDGTFEDITERKLAEEALRESERRYQMLAQVSPVGIFRTDAQGQTTFVNPRWCEIAGLSPSEASGLGWLRAVHPQDREKLAQGWNEATQAQRISTADFRFLRPDGTVAWVMGQSVPEKDDEGHIVGYVGTITDVTDRMRADWLLRAFNQAALSMASALTPAEIFTAVAQELGHLGFSCMLFPLDESQGRLLTRYMSYESGILDALERLVDIRHQDFSIPVETVETYRRVIRERQTTLTEQTEEAMWQLLPEPARRFAGQIVRALRVPKSIAAPLIVEDRVIGLFSVQSNDLSADDMPAVTAFAHQVAAAWHKAELLEQVQARRRYFETLLQINATLRSTLPLDQVLEMVSRSAGEVLGYRGCLIVVPDAAGERLVLGAAWGGGFLEAALRFTGLGVGAFSLPLASEKNPMALAYRDNKIQSWSRAPGRIVADIEPAISPRLASPISRVMGAERATCVPLAVGEKVLGVLAVFSPQEEFSAEERAMLLGLADQAGLAIENARLYQAAQQEIAARKQAEDEIRRLNEELERRVIERTTQLEASNKELEAFSYSVSHDLRAPLRAIDGFARILLEEHTPQLSSEAARYLRIIFENAQQMGRLIEGLLAFSRLSRQPISKRPIPTADLVRQALEALSSEQAGQRVEISIGALPPCQGDPALLRQVWVNLLSNALKFTGGRETAKIEVGSLNQEDGTPVYFVKDNGAGFDMQYAGKLFGVFQRLHSMEEFEGTGVGLATVQRIIHRHGGQVWAKAEVNRGATFYFTI